MKVSCFFIILTLPVLLLAGCSPRLTAAQRAAEVVEVADLPVMCKAGQDCDEKWDRAGQWVTQHSAYKIAIQSDTVIQTEEPMGMDKRAAFSVTRVLNNDDIYDIKFKITCNNWFGCIPGIADAKADFVNFVTAAHANTLLPKFGVRVHPVSAATAKAEGIEGTRGVVAVIKVKQKSIANKAGLLEGDVLVQYDGKTAATESELQELVANTPADQKVNILIYRNKEMKTLKAQF